MTTEPAAAGFISTCPCGWHVYSSDQPTALRLKEAHRCKEEA